MARQGAVRVSITGDNSGLRRELQQSERGINTFAKKSTKHFTAVGKGAAGASSSLKKAAGAASALGAGYLAIAEAKEAINVTVELGKATKSLNANLGIGVRRSSEWAAVAKVRGIESKQLAQAFGTLAKQERQAGEGAKSSVQAFKDLGLSQKELKNQDFNTTLGEVADGLGNLKGGADKTAISMKLFGRGWQTVVPVLRDGSKAMEEQLALARKYGVTFSGKTLKSTTDLVKAQREMKFATLGLQLAFGQSLAPALAKILPKVANFLNEMRKGKGAGGDFVDTIKAIAGVVKDAVPVVQDLIGFINKLSPAFKLIKFTSIGLMQIAFKNLIKLIPRVMDLFRALGRAIAEKFGRVFGNVMATVIRGFGKLFQLASHLPGVGGKFDRLARDANEFADKVDRIGEKASDSKSQLQQLTSREWPVKVSLKIGAKSGIPGFDPLVPPSQLGSGGPLLGDMPKNVADAIGGWVKGNRKSLEGAFAPSLGGGALGGGVDQFTPIAARFGLGIGPGGAYRPGDPGFHGLNRARDYSNGYATPEELRFARRMAGTYGNKLSELIHTPLGFGIKNGAVVPLSYWGAATNADHYDHVHVALQRGGTIPGSGVGDKVPVMAEPGEGFINKRAVSAMGGAGAINAINSLVPRFQKGGMVRAAKAGRAAGFRGRALQTLLAVGGAESGNYTDMVGDEQYGGSYGPWQVNHPAHPEYNIRRLQTDWTYSAKAAYQISRGGRDWSPWTTYRNGAYGDYMAQAASVLAGSTKQKQKAKAKRPRKTSNQKRKDRISAGSFAGRLRGAGSDPWTGAFSAQMDSALALAELTPGLGDDRAAQVQALQGWLGFLDTGKRTGNQSLITAGAQGVKGAIDAIKSIDEELSGSGGGNSLADALTELASESKQLREAMTDRNAYMKSLANTSKEVAVQALADVISGQIGGQTSQRRRSAGDGVTVARY